MPMKPLLSLLLFSAFLPFAGTFAASPAAERDSVYLLLQDFEEEFARTHQNVHNNVPQAPGDIRTVYDIYRSLSDEAVLLDRGIIRQRRPGPYATSQSQINFYRLPLDSTLCRLEAYLLLPDSIADASQPESEELRTIEAALEGPPSELRKHVISDFRPALKVPADSVIYITPVLQNKLTACLRAAVENGLPPAVIERVNALIPVKRGLWGGLRIIKPFVVNYIVLDNQTDRAYISVLTESSDVYAILMVLDKHGMWKISAARLLGSIIT